MGVYIIDLLSEICSPVLKLDFTALGITESFSEFEPWCVVHPQRLQARGQVLIGVLPAKLEE
jgi:hypothetical protein